jgi:hypothetical protein
MSNSVFITRAVHNIIFFESHVFEVALPEQPTWKSLGNRIVVAYMRGNAQVRETERTFGNRQLICCPPQLFKLSFE